MVNQIALQIKKLSLAAPLLVGMMLLAGCTAQPGAAVLTYESNNVTVPPLNIVDTVGLYALFPGSGITPLDAVYLYKGDKFGFRSSDGKTVGTYIRAGDTKEIPLDGILSSEYIWRYQGDKKP